MIDEVPPSESIKLMGTGEIIPSEAQPEEELIISAPNEPEDNAQPEEELIISAPNQPEDNAQPKTILPMMTMISKSKIFVLYIPVLQMKCRLRE